MRSPTQPTTSSSPITQRKVAAHQRIHLGQAEEEQELEKDIEGTHPHIQTFNLIEFLLKNGPPSIISNFKYDLYQLRAFESYSSYVDGLDKGEPSKCGSMQSENGPRLCSIFSAMRSFCKRKGSRPRLSARRCPMLWAAPHMGRATEAAIITTAASVATVVVEAVAMEAAATDLPNPTATKRRMILITTEEGWDISETTHTTNRRSISTKTPKTINL